jgi:hypothetical protein
VTTASTAYVTNDDSRYGPCNQSDTRERRHPSPTVGVKRMIASTYQAASGAGALAMAELEQQTRDVLAGDPGGAVYKC